MLRLTPEVRDQMFAHALTEAPNEACGMFSAHERGELVDEFHAMRNVADSALVFVLDGQEMLDLEREVENAGRTLVGVMHSHTTTSPYPSPTDVRDAGRFDPFGVFDHVIVSLRHAEPVLRSFRIMGETITEVPVIIDDGDMADDDADGSGSATAIAAVMPLPKR